MDAERIAALEDLVLLRSPVEAAAKQCKRLPWDSDTELIVLTANDCLRLLDGFVQGDLTGDDCELWASTVEGRDDIGLQPGSEVVLKEFLFDLSTPELQGRLTPEKARNWQHRFGQGT
jgi:hypothetical protein